MANRTRAGLVLPALALFGCLGGDLDTPPARANPLDTVPVPRDTVPAQPTPVHALFPALKPGEKWVYAQWSQDYSGAEATLRIGGESVFGGDSVYIETLTVRVPEFLTAFGDTVRDFSQHGLTFLRKSDQETVRDTLTTLATVHYQGDSAGTPYRLEETTTATISGALPDSLKAGASWKLSLTRRRKSAWFFGADPGGTRDTTWTQVRNYQVKASPDVKVKAGSFAALEIDWSASGSGAGSRGWFAPAAKAMVREIDLDSGSADTTELDAYLLQ